MEIDDVKTRMGKETRIQGKRDGAREGDGERGKRDEYGREENERKGNETRRQGKRDGTKEKDGEKGMERKKEG